MTAAQLQVEPLWSSVPCAVNVSEDVTLIRGSLNHSCSLQVTASQGSNIQLQINGPVNISEEDSYRYPNGYGDYFPSLDSMFLYIERLGDVEYCSNKYIAFHELSEQCNYIIAHRNVTIFLQGDVRLSINERPAEGTMVQCPEFNQDMMDVRVSQSSLCTSEQGYNNKLTCSSESDWELCVLKFGTNCDTILGDREVIYKCNDVSQNQRALIAYPIYANTIDLAGNNLVEIKERSLQSIFLCTCIGPRPQYVEGSTRGYIPRF
jgi:hypothetical protein